MFALAFVRNVMDNDALPEVNPYFEEVAREEGFYSPQVHAGYRRPWLRPADVDGVPEDVTSAFLPPPTMFPLNITSACRLLSRSMWITPFQQDRKLQP